MEEEVEEENRTRLPGPQDIRELECYKLKKIGQHPLLEFRNNHQLALTHSSTTFLSHHHRTQHQSVQAEHIRRGKAVTSSTVNS